MFTNNDIAEYFDSTQNHYKKWWNLGKSLSLHYGIWDKGIKTFSESLINTNRVLWEISEITEKDRVLDAGCGVGGAALFINKESQAEVLGISISNRQINFANELALKNNVTDKVSFKVMDFTKTEFADDNFDVVWACESVCQAPDKEAFIRESHRILKKGGRLILSDYFLTNDNQEDKHRLIKKWCDIWTMHNIVSCDHFTTNLKKQGFNFIRVFDYTDKIMKSAMRLFFASILGAIPSEFYNFFNPSVSRFAKNHYKGGYFQYRALREGLWQYIVLLAVK